MKFMGQGISVEEEVRLKFLRKNGFFDLNSSKDLLVGFLYFGVDLDSISSFRITVRFWIPDWIQILDFGLDSDFGFRIGFQVGLLTFNDDTRHRHSNGGVVIPGVLIASRHR